MGGMQELGTMQDTALEAHGAALVALVVAQEAVQEVPEVDQEVALVVTVAVMEGTFMMTPLWTLSEILMSTCSQS